MADTPDHTPMRVALWRFRDAIHVSADDYAACYFAGRTDGLRPASSEQLLVASP